MTKKEMYQMMDEAFTKGNVNVNITFNGEKFYFEINGEIYEFIEKVNKRKKDSK